MSSGKQYLLSFTTFFNSLKGYTIAFNLHENVENRKGYPYEYLPWNRYTAMVMDDSKLGVKTKVSTGILYPVHKVGEITDVEGELENDPISAGMLDYFARVNEYIQTKGVMEDAVSGEGEEGVTSFLQQVADILEDVKAEIVVNVIKESGTVVTVYKDSQVDEGGIKVLRFTPINRIEVLKGDQAYSTLESTSLRYTLSDKLNEVFKYSLQPLKEVSKVIHVEEDDKLLIEESELVQEMGVQEIDGGEIISDGDDTRTEIGRSFYKGLTLLAEGGNRDEREEDSPITEIVPIEETNTVKEISDPKVTSAGRLMQILYGDSVVSEMERGFNAAIESFEQEKSQYGYVKHESLVDLMSKADEGLIDTEQLGKSIERKTFQESEKGGVTPFNITHDAEVQKEGRGEVVRNIDLQSFIGAKSFLYSWAEDKVNVGDKINEVSVNEYSGAESISIVHSLVQETINAMVLYEVGLDDFTDGDVVKNVETESVTVPKWFYQTVIEKIDEINSIVFDRIAVDDLINGEHGGVDVKEYTLTESNSTSVRDAVKVSTEKAESLTDVVVNVMDETSLFSEADMQRTMGAGFTGKGTETEYIEISYSTVVEKEFEGDIVELPSGSSVQEGYLTEHQDLTDKVKYLQEDGFEKGYSVAGAVVEKEEESTTFIRSIKQEIEDFIMKGKVEEGEVQEPNKVTLDPTIEDSEIDTTTLGVSVVDTNVDTVVGVDSVAGIVLDKFDESESNQLAHEDKLSAGDESIGSSDLADTIHLSKSNKAQPEGEIQKKIGGTNYKEVEEELITHAGKKAEGETKSIDKGVKLLREGDQIPTIGGAGVLDYDGEVERATGHEKYIKDVQQERTESAAKDREDDAVIEEYIGTESAPLETTFTSTVKAVGGAVETLNHVLVFPVSAAVLATSRKELEKTLQPYVDTSLLGTTGSYTVTPLTEVVYGEESELTLHYLLDLMEGNEESNQQKEIEIVLVSGGQSNSESETYLVDGVGSGETVHTQVGVTEEYIGTRSLKELTVEETSLADSRHDVDVQEVIDSETVVDVTESELNEGILQLGSEVYVEEGETATVRTGEEVELSRQVEVYHLQGVTTDSLPVLDRAVSVEYAGIGFEERATDLPVEGDEPLTVIHTSGSNDFEGEISNHEAGAVINPLAEVGELIGDSGGASRVAVVQSKEQSEIRVKENTIEAVDLITPLDKDIEVIQTVGWENKQIFDTEDDYLQQGHEIYPETEIETSVGSEQVSGEIMYEKYETASTEVTTYDTEIGEREQGLINTPDVLTIGLEVFKKSSGDEAEVDYRGQGLMKIPEAEIERKTDTDTTSDQDVVIGYAEQAGGWNEYRGHILTRDSGKALDKQVDNIDGEYLRKSQITDAVIAKEETTTTQGRQEYASIVEFESSGKDSGNVAEIAVKGERGTQKYPEVMLGDEEVGERYLELQADKGKLEKSEKLVSTGSTILEVEGAEQSKDGLMDERGLDGATNVKEVDSNILQNELGEHKGQTGTVIAGYEQGSSKGQETSSILDVIGGTVDAIADININELDHFITWLDEQSTVFDQLEKANVYSLEEVTVGQIESSYLERSSEANVSGGNTATNKEVILDTGMVALEKMMPHVREYYSYLQEDETALNLGLVLDVGESNTEEGVNSSTYFTDLGAIDLSTISKEINTDKVVTETGYVVTLADSLKAYGEKATTTSSVLVQLESIDKALIKSVAETVLETIGKADIRVNGYETIREDGDTVEVSGATLLTSLEEVEEGKANRTGDTSLEGVDSIDLQGIYKDVAVDRVDLADLIKTLGVGLERTDKVTVSETSQAEITNTLDEMRQLGFYAVLKTLYGGVKDETEDVTISSIESATEDVEIDAKVVETETSTQSMVFSETLGHYLEEVDVRNQQETAIEVIRAGSKESHELSAILVGVEESTKESQLEIDIQEYVQTYNKGNEVDVDISWAEQASIGTTSKEMYITSTDKATTSLTLDVELEKGYELAFITVLRFEGYYHEGDKADYGTLSFESAVETTETSNPSIAHIDTFLEGDDLAKRMKKRITLPQEDEEADRRKMPIVVEDGDTAGRRKSPIVLEEDGQAGRRKQPIILHEDEGVSRKSVPIVINEDEEAQRMKKQIELVQDETSSKTKAPINLTEESVGKGVERKRRIEIVEDDLAVGLVPEEPPYEEPREPKKMWLIMGKPFPAWSGWNPKKTR